MNVAKLQRNYLEKFEENQAVLAHFGRKFDWNDTSCWRRFSWWEEFLLFFSFAGPHPATLRQIGGRTYEVRQEFLDELMRSSAARKALQNGSVPSIWRQGVKPEKVCTTMFLAKDGTVVKMVTDKPIPIGTFEVLSAEIISEEAARKESESWGRG
jgi:hypothetical protein